MKSILIVLFAIIVVIAAAPSQISNNNVGDIVNVGVTADLDVINQIDYTRVDVDLIWKNLQALIVALGGDNNPEVQSKLVQMFTQLLEQQE
ncbi:unnamed protein product [Chironomus riparius]|uniref:Uncharacterized protein n=1 Tax=Chironomus riparius TaxID=315576 RepID=A0A9N9RSM9_9DIPT|nr:unnamed protein product [Chironomus riparius]